MNFFCVIKSRIPRQMKYKSQWMFLIHQKVTLTKLKSQQIFLEVWYLPVHEYTIFNSLLLQPFSSALNVLSWSYWQGSVKQGKTFLIAHQNVQNDAFHVFIFAGSMFYAVSWASGKESLIYYFHKSIFSLFKNNFWFANTFSFTKFTNLDNLYYYIFLFNLLCKQISRFFENRC